MSIYNEFNIESIDKESLILVGYNITSNFFINFLSFKETTPFIQKMKNKLRNSFIGFLMSPYNEYTSIKNNYIEIKIESNHHYDNIEIYFNGEKELEIINIINGRGDRRPLRYKDLYPFLKKNERYVKIDTLCK